MTKKERQPWQPGPSLVKGEKVRNRMVREKEMAKARVRKRKSPKKASTNILFQKSPRRGGSFF
jgi:hypothetical protein